MEVGLKNPNYMINDHPCDAFFILLIWPLCQMFILFYNISETTEFGEIKEFKGNIFECIKEAISYIQNHISYKSVYGILKV